VNFAIEWVPSLYLPSEKPTSILMNKTMVIKIKLVTIFKITRKTIRQGATVSELLKAVEAAARKLSSTMAARDVVQRSLDGIIAEQERRAAANAAE